MFNPLVEDYLKESFNRGLGKATSSLTEITGSDSEIEFGVPNFHYQNLSNLKNQLPIMSKLCGVSQSFKGEINGSGILFFSPEIGSDLIHLLLKTDVPIDFVSDVEADAITEVANILMNFNLKALLDDVNLSFSSRPPVFEMKEAYKFFNPDDYSHNQKVLLLNANIFNKETRLNGSINFVLYLNEMEGVFKKIETYMKELIGDVG